MIRATGLVVCAMGAILSVVGSAAAADLPAPVAAAEQAAGGESQLASLGYLSITGTESETTPDGKNHSNTFQALVGTDGLELLQVDITPQVKLVTTPAASWAMVKGALDQRPSSGMMARGTVHEKIFPVLLPFSLAMKGITVGAVEDTTFEGTPVWRVAVTVPRDFFASAVMNTVWHVLIAKKDHRVVAAEFQPPAQYRSVQLEGVRYRYESFAKIKGCSLPSEVLIEGIDANGAPNSHFAKLELTMKPVSDVPRTTFVHPKVLERLDKGDVVPPPGS